MAPAPELEPSWPPQSPHEALCRMPGGRRRYQQILEQTSPTPSPSRLRLEPMLDSSPGRKLGAPVAVQDDGDEDEDEETLQLKLQEIQARLRLKRLQNSKLKEASGSTGDEVNDDLRKGPLPPGDDVFGPDDAPVQTSGKQATPNVGKSRPQTKTQTGVQDPIQVPVSPVRTRRPSLLPTSPSRVLLGIDKGLRAGDVSLKRAPKAKPSIEKQGSTASCPASSAATPRPKSFNERLASARSEDAFRAQRQERIQKVRSNAFGIGKQEMEDFRRNARDIPDKPLQAPTFSREDVLSQRDVGAGRKLSRSKSTPALSVPTVLDAGQSQRSSASTAAVPPAGEDEKTSSFETYSATHLSRRILPHRVLARHVSGKKVMNIKDVLRDVKSPDYELPDVEQDIVVFAIVAKKSEPRTHKGSRVKPAPDSAERGKYMVMTLCNLALELELFLFDSGFTKYWKLAEGTVIAILNPSIMPPPSEKQDTGRFSLVINSDEDTILEIGSARDLGFCQSIKKDGSLCGSWINKKRTQFCEYHSNEAIRRQRASRIEVNWGDFGDRPHRGKGAAGGKGANDWKQMKQGSENFDWETKTRWFASRYFSAAQLLDGKDAAPANQKEKRAFLKRNLEAKEKEREIMQQLGHVGHAAGREYMQRAGCDDAPKDATDGGSGRNGSTKGKGSGSGSGNSNPTSSATVTEATGGRGEPLMLGIAAGKERAIHLSPVKRKRAGSSQASSAAGSIRSTGFGWGGDLRQKLSGLKEAATGGARRQGERSPVRKKTRFVTDKGIREAGRESLGADLSGGLLPLGRLGGGREADHDEKGDEGNDVDDDNDDELVIVR